MKLIGTWATLLASGAGAEQLVGFAILLVFEWKRVQMRGSKSTWLHCMLLATSIALGAPVSAHAQSEPAVGWETFTVPMIKGPIPGPLNVGDERPPVQKRCTYPPNRPPCDYAFIDSSHRKVDIFNDLLIAIDSHAALVPELQPWIRTEGARSDIREEAKFPYRMYLLTISPAVVLVVPSLHSFEEFVRDPCRGTLLFRGCIQSQSFRGNLYYFQEAPAVAAGSFWFTTAEPAGVVHPLSTEQGLQEISPGTAVLRLVQNAGRWQVQRIK